MAEYDLPGINILLHNQAGLRIELNLYHQGTLTLWFSPLAGQSIDYRERNFSNRDDHTSVFDRITLPDLSQDSFISCDYDPTHAIVHFQNQTIHLLPHHRDSALILWAEKPQKIDFKTNANDEVLARTIDAFIIRHKDRWHEFAFAARISDDESRILHQVRFDEGRSSYARVQLSSEKPLTIYADLASENYAQKSTDLAGKSVSHHIEQTHNHTKQAFSTGSLELKNHEDWAQLYEVCRKHLLTARDYSGAVHGALNRIYYLIWVRDGAFIENNIASSGWSYGAGRWNTFLLANPTKIQDKASAGRAFLMLVNQLTKWEEDGFFYAVWSAFSALSQWGQILTPQELTTLEDALSWLENYCFDNDKGLFGRNYACETPFMGSPDFGYDNAVGYPSDSESIKSSSGKNPLLSYDIYINETAFSAYCMLAALHSSPETADTFLVKAKSLQARMKKWFSKSLPTYGLVLLEDGQTVMEPPYGLDLTDYVWAFTAPPITSHPHMLPEIRKRLLEESKGRASEYFICAYFSLIRSLDTLYIDEAIIEEAIDYAVEQSSPPGETLSMPYAIKEKLDAKDGDRWHDVRPQSFSAAPFIASLTSLLIRTLPFGLALRSSGIVNGIDKYEYRNRKITINNRCGQVGFQIAISIDGSSLVNSLQIPESMLQSEDINIEISKAPSVPFAPVLVASSVRLHAIASRANTVEYTIECFGFNSLQFDGHSLDFKVTEQISGQSCEWETYENAECTFINFWARGNFCLKASRIFSQAEPSSNSSRVQSIDSTTISQ